MPLTYPFLPGCYTVFQSLNSLLGALFGFERLKREFEIACMRTQVILGSLCSTAIWRAGGGGVQGMNDGFYHNFSTLMKIQSDFSFTHFFIKQSFLREILLSPQTCHSVFVWCQATNIFTS